MKNRHKNKSKFLLSIISLFLVICSFGLVACSWGQFGGDTQSSSSETDSNGRTRISMSSVEYKGLNANGTVDSSTGSFEWDLVYYFNSRNINADASSSYQSVFYKNTTELDQNAIDKTVSKDILSYSTEKGYWVNTSNTSDNNAYYSLEHNALRYINYGNPVANGTSYNALPYPIIPRFASYSVSDYNQSVLTISLSLKAKYLSNIVVDYTNPGQLFSITGTKEDGSPVTVADIFEISYTMPSTTSAEPITYIQSEKDVYNVAEIYQANNGKFRLRYNPILTKGAQNRYIRVAALSEVDNAVRGDSLYTAPVTFNVYAMTFAANCINSNENTYEALTYDNTKYYFEVKNEYIENANQYASLTGYFVEGRIVEVSRSMDASGDYALQNWTSIVKAENTYVLNDYLPEDVAFDQDYLISETNKKSILSSFSKEQLNAREVAIKSSLSLNSNSVENSHQEIIDEITSSTGKTYKGKISVICTSSNSSKTFYANIAKVRNYILSGTIYDTEDLLGSNATILTGAEIYIWKQGSSTPFVKITETNFDVLNQTEYENHLLAMGIDKISYTYANGVYNIQGLSYDTYLAFAKQTNNSDDLGHNYYTFFSNSMVKLVEDDSNSSYILNNLKNGNIYADKVNTIIYGTKYETNSKVAVNLFVKKNQAETTSIDNIAGEKISYQVVSTTQEETDIFGYTTSRVIISLLLPSNYTMKSYNIESVTNIGEMVYVSETDPNSVITCIISYNEESRRPIYTYYYTTIENNISVSTTGSLSVVYYDGNPYEYVRRDTTFAEDGTQYYDYYYTMLGDNGNKATILRRENKSTGIVEYVHYSYNLVDQIISSKDDQVDQNNPWIFTSAISNDGTAEDGKIAVLYTLEYHDQNNNLKETYIYSPENYRNTDIEIVAKAYGTNIKTVDGTEIYAYYNVNSYSYTNGSNKVTEYYYVQPVGELTVIDITKSGNDNLQINWYNQEFEDIISNDIAQIYLYNNEIIIARGDYIISNSDQFANFVKAINGTASIIANNYYLIKRLSNPVDVYISQFVNTDAGEQEKTISVFNSYSEGVGKYLSADGKEIDSNFFVVHFVENDGNFSIDEDYKSNYNNASAPTYYILDESKVKDDTNFEGVSNQKFVEKQVEVEEGIYETVYEEAENGNLYLITDNNGNTRYELVEDIDKLVKFSYDAKNAKYYYNANGNYIATTNDIYVQDANFSRTHYTSRLYDGTPVTDSVKHIYSLKGLAYDSENRKQIEFASTSNNGSYILGETEYILSTTADNWRLYSGSAGDYKPYSATLSDEFVNQEKNNTIIKNAASVGLYDSKYYLEEREFYGSDTNKVTVVYTLYVYKTQDNSQYPTIYAFTILFDGTDFYVALNSTVFVSVNNDEQYQPYSTLLKLNGAVLNISETASITFAEQEGTDWKVNSTSGDYSLYVQRQYYAYPQNSQSSDLTTLGDELYTALIYKTDKSTPDYSPCYILTNATFNYIATEYKYVDDNGNPIYASVSKVIISGSSNKIVRQAKLKSDQTDIHLLGKVVLLENGESVTYPAFDYYLNNDSENIIDDTNNYYDIDYTTVDAVISAFPGVNLLSGAPYASPVFSFEVHHKAEEQAVINVGLEIVDGYYVELMTNAIASASLDIIYDFSTISFKDTITNLTTGNKINNLYYVLFADTYNTVVAYTKNKDGQYEEYLNGTPLTIQNIKINDNSTNVYSTIVSENGQYDTVLYYFDGTNYVLLDYTKLIIWNSNANELSTIPFFDIHSYRIEDNGLIYLQSDTNDNEICHKVDNIYISGMDVGANTYNYDEVLISGATSAYRVNANDLILADFSNTLQSFWLEDAINIQHSYNAKDAYFLAKQEGIVLIASPVVSISDNNNENKIYRFKRWEIFSRYNSEVIYKNVEAINKVSSEINNAIIRFVSDNAGYFIFMPVYERVYTINLSTSIVNGPNNLGGSVEVVYNKNSGKVINLENSNFTNKGNSTIYTIDTKNANTAYFVDYVKTQENGVENYYFRNLSITPTLYFTGNYGKAQVGTKVYDVYPIFQQKELVTFDGAYYIVDENGAISKVIFNEDSTCKTSAGLIIPQYQNGSYSFAYQSESMNFPLKGTISDFSVLKYADENGTINENEETTATDFISYSYTVSHFPGSDNLYFVYKKDNAFYAINSIYFTQNPSTNIDDLINQNSAINFANLKIVEYNSIALWQNDKYAFYNKDENAIYNFATSANILDGELYYDQDGNINTELQFKTTYIDRDTKIIISANASSGYRLEGWYLAEYNEKSNSWVVSDTPLDSTLNKSYSDIIRKVECVDSANDVWYYVTDYYQTNEAGQKIYYYSYKVDEETGEEIFSNPSIVPDQSKDKVRGSYYLGEDNCYYPLYRDGSNYYTDILHKNKYEGTPLSLAHYNAITEILDNNSNKFYYIGNERVYYVDGQFYRTEADSNFTLKDGKIYIENLHSNMRIVAKFVEVYQSFIFAEEPDEENIEVFAVYYSSQVKTKEDETGSTIVTGRTGARSDANGNVLVDNIVKGIDLTEFVLDKDKTRTLTSADVMDQNGNYSIYYINQDINFANYFTNDAQIADISAGSIEKQVAANGYNINRKVTKDGKDLNNTKTNIAEPTDLNMVNMFFDENTPVYVAVRVHYDQVLTIHSLGLLTSNVLEPVMYPCDDYISINSSRGEEQRDEYYYYVFKVMFNRDISIDYIESGKKNYSQTGNVSIDNQAKVKYSNFDVNSGNYSPEYIIHPNRGQSLVGDVFAGNYTLAYSNMFNFYYDNNKIFEIDANNKLAFTNEYKNAINSKYSNEIDETTWTNDGNGYSNLADFFAAVKTKYAIILSVSYVTDTEGTKVTSYDEIFNIISNYFKQKGKNSPYQTGITNYINLSSIPVYTYSASIQVIDEYTNSFAKYDNDAKTKLKNAGLDFIQRIWTRAGYQGYTYIGGEEISEPKRIQGSAYSKYFTVDDTINDMFAEDFALARNTIMALGGLGVKQNGNTYATSIDQTVTTSTTINDIVVENEFKYENGIFSITLNKGTEDEEIYVFAGWFEQKMINKTITNGNGEEETIKAWSDMQLMGTEIETPFESTAYANTNIIALFEKVEKISFKFEKNAFTLNFNSLRDSLNNQIKVENDNSTNTTTVSGYFKVTDNISIDVTPAGGYRFTGELLRDNNSTVLTSYFNVSQDGGSTICQNNFAINTNGTKTYIDLAKTINISFVAGSIIADNDFDKNKVIVIGNKEIVATYVQVGGYYTVETDNSVSGSGVEFVLIQQNSDDTYSILAQTEFDSASQEVHNAVQLGQAKDSANRTIRLAVYEDKSLSISGYFDKELSGKLFLGSIISTNIQNVNVKCWYINEYKEFTNQMDPRLTPSKITIDDKEFADLFKICYMYDESNISLFDVSTNEPITTNLDVYAEDFNRYFSLGENIVGYVAKAEVEKNTTLSVGYAQVESMNAIDSTNLIDKTNNGSISWTGKKIDYDEFDNEIVSTNGSAEFTGTELNSYVISSITSTTLLTTLESYTVGDDVYKFIGWFNKTADGLVTYSASVTANVVGGGEYYAVYAKTVKLSNAKVVTIDENKTVVATNLNGTISIESGHIDSTINSILDVIYVDNENVYVAVDAKISATVVAEQGYIIDKIEIVNANDQSVVSYSTNPDYNTNSYPANLSVGNKAFEAVGYVMKASNVAIQKVYFDTLNMLDSGTLCTYGVVTIDEDLTKTLSSGTNGISSANYNYKKGDVINLSFTNTSEYGLIGFYVNGALIGDITQYVHTTSSNADVYSTTYTVVGDVTIEARITKFVTIDAKSQTINTTTSNAQNVTISYVDYYTGIMHNANNIAKPSTNAQVTVLSGTTLNLSTQATSTNFAFIDWTLGEKYVADQNDVSVLAENDLDIFVANYNTTKEVTIIREVTSINSQDSAFTSKEMKSLLDISITYTNKLGTEVTIFLGSKDSAVINILSGTQYSISSKMDSNVADRYGFYIKENTSTNVSYDEPYTPKNIDAVNTITFSYYAKRTVTISRYVNNAPSNTNVLNLSLHNESSTNGAPYSLGANYSLTAPTTNKTDGTSTKLALSDSLHVKADPIVTDVYEFAGFYVNGKFFDKNDANVVEKSGVTWLYLVNNTKSGYADITNDTHISIVAVWYSKTKITTYVMLDGEYLNASQTINTEEDIVPAYNNGVSVVSEDLANKLTMKLYGNRLTGLVDGDNNLNGLYNTTLQLTTATNGKTEKYMSNSNLGLIASSYAGYQFVGFYYGVKGTDINSFTKLDSINQNGQVTYGNALTSIFTIPSKIATDRTEYLVTNASDYVIVAKYLSTYSISQSITLYNDESTITHEYLNEDKAKLEPNFVLFDDQLQFIQLEKQNNQFVKIEEDQMAVINGAYSSKNYNGFYPNLSSYVAIKTPTHSDYTFVGIYLNGTLYESVGTYEDNKTVYSVYDLSEFVSETDNIININNVFAEFRYARNVDFIVRIGVNNTNDIEKVDNSLLDNIKIKISTFNPYTNTTSEEYYTNSKSTGANSYWNTVNKSLYIKLTLPVGTTISTDIISTTEDKPTIGDLKYYGWFMYTHQSVAESNTAINYTTNCTFAIHEDTDIVAQFPGNEVPEKTTDTQFAYHFVGKDFGGLKNFDPTLSSDVDNNAIALLLTEYLKGVKAGTVAASGTISSNIYSLEITPVENTDNLVFEIKYNGGEARRFLFTGWYQEIKLANTKKYLFVTNTIGLDYSNAESQMPTQIVNATNMMAEFVEICEITFESSINNTANFDYFYQNYNTFVDYSVFGNQGVPSNDLDLLNIKVDKNGKVTAFILYGNQLFNCYKIVNGYYENTTNLSFDSNTYSKFVTEDYSDYKNIYNTQKTKYKYTVSQTENILETLSVSPNVQSTVTSNTSVNLSSRAVASFSTASISTPVIKLMGTSVEEEISDFELDESSLDTNQSSSVNIIFNAEDISSTNAKIIVTIIRPNGVIETITINNTLTATIKSVGRTATETKDVNVTKQGKTTYILTITNSIKNLPLGTKINVNVDTSSCDDEAINSISLRRNDEPITSGNSYTATSNSITYLTTSADGGAMLTFEIVIANKFALSVADNNNEQGAIDISYSDGNYTAVIDANNNHTLKNLTFEIRVADVDHSITLTDLFDAYLLKAYDSLEQAYALSLAKYETTGFNSTLVDTYWTITINNDGTITVTFEEDSKTYFSVILTFNFVETADSTGFAYIDNISSQWTLKSNVAIATVYEHVTIISLTQIKEKLLVETENQSESLITKTEIVTDKNGDVITKTVYALDNWLFTLSNDNKYIIYEKLNKAYQNELKDTSCTFVGYSYGGKMIKETESSSGILIIAEGQTCSNNIDMIAQFIDKVSLDFVINVEYYQGVDNTLNTPINNITLSQNSNSQSAFETISEVKKIEVNINDATNITIFDTKEYFKFVEWNLKYGDNYVKDDNKENIKLQTPSLLFDSNLLINLANIINRSNKVAISQIDFNKIKIVAQLKEDPIVVDINYEISDETFKIIYGSNNVEINDDNSNVLTNGDEVVIIKRTQVSSQNAAENQDTLNKLSIVYSKSTTPSTITVVAKEYQKRNDFIARTDLIGTNSAVRMVSDDGNYSGANFYKLNGFRNSIGQVFAITRDGVSNTIEIDAIDASATYSLDTTTLYLIEAGRALQKNTETAGEAIKINDKTISNQFMTDSSNMSYAVISYLVEEGTLVTVEFVNPEGTDIEYKNPATTHSYRTMAISTQKTLSDIIKTFKNDKGYSYIYDASVSDWKELNKNGDTPFYTTLNQHSQNNIIDKETSYTFIATSSASFIADHIGIFDDQKYYLNVLIGADDSTIFEFDNGDIRNIYRADNFIITSATSGTRISYVIAENFNLRMTETNNVKVVYPVKFDVENSLNQYSYYLSTENINTTTNKVIYNKKEIGDWIAENNQIKFDDSHTITIKSVGVSENGQLDRSVLQYVSGDLPEGYKLNVANYIYVEPEIQYTLSDSYILRTSQNSGTVSTSDINVAYLTENGKNNNKISLTQQNYQIVIGLINNKTVSASAKATTKYMSTESNGRKNILEDLAEALGGTSTYFDHGFNGLNPANVAVEKAYVSNKASNETIKLENLYNSITLQKNSNITLLAKVVPGYQFYGFIIISQHNPVSIEMNAAFPVQNITNPSELRYKIFGGKTTIITASNAKNISVGEDNYYAVTDTFEGNVQVYAIYQAQLKVINIDKKLFDEDKIQNGQGSTFIPNPTALRYNGIDPDADTTKGKIQTESLIFETSSTSKTLTISANGFGEYKGATVNGIKIGAVYSESEKLSDERIDNYIENFNNAYDSTTNQTTITGQTKFNGATYGYLTSGTLFTNEYAVKDEFGDVKQNPSSINYLYLIFDDYTKYSLANQNDITIYVYFSEVFYTINTQITEYTGKAKTSTTQVDSNIDPYLGYSEEFLKTNNNPTYTSDNKYGITAKDPYVYTWYDCNGILLAQPVKVTLDMVSMDPDETNDFIRLKDSNGNVGGYLYTQSSRQDNSRIKTENVVTQVYDTIQNVFDYVIENPNYEFSFKPDLFTIKVNDTQIDSGSIHGYKIDMVDENGNKYYMFIYRQGIVKIATTIDTIYNNISLKIKVYADPNSGFPSVAIYNGSSQDHESDEYGVGYQTIALEKNDNVEFVDNDGNSQTSGYSIFVADNCNATYAAKYENSTQKLSGTFFTDALMYEEDTKTLIIDKDKYPEFNIYSIMNFERLSKNVSAHFTIDGLQNSYDIDFANPQSSALTYINAIKEYFSSTEYNDCGNTNHPRYISGELSLLDGFDIYIIKNTQPYIAALEKALTYSYLTSGVKAKIAMLLGEINGFNPATNITFPNYGNDVYISSNDDTNVSNQIAKRKAAYVLPQSGDIFDYTTITKLEVVELLRYTIGEKILADRLEKSNDLTFQRYNILENFMKGIRFDSNLSSRNNVVSGQGIDVELVKNLNEHVKIQTGIDPSYLGNTITYGDSAVTVSKLTEHVFPHKYSNFWEGETPGYVYIDNMISEWEGFTSAQTNGRGVSTYYDNNYANTSEISEISIVELSNWNKFTRWVAGITNRGKKYANSYTMVSHIGITPTAKEFIDSTNNLIVSKSTINASTEKHIKTTNLNQEHSSVFKNVIYVIGVSAASVASIVLTVVTHGAASVLIGIAATAATGYAAYENVMLVVGIATNGEVVSQMMANTMNHLDFSMFE